MTAVCVCPLQGSSLGGDGRLLLAAALGCWEAEHAGGPGPFAPDLPPHGRSEETAALSEKSFRPVGISLG